MTQNEMLAGLHGLARWLDKHDFKPSGDIVRAAITALEAVPVHVEAHPAPASNHTDEHHKLREALKHIRETTCIRTKDDDEERTRCAGPGCPGWVAARVLKGESWQEQHDTSPPAHVEKSIDDADVPRCFARPTPGQPSGGPCELTAGHVGWHKRKGMEWAPAEVKTPPSESAIERARQWWDWYWSDDCKDSPAGIEQLAAEFDQHTAAALAEAQPLAVEQEEIALLRAELAQTRGDVVRLQNELASHRQR